MGFRKHLFYKLISGVFAVSLAFSPLTVQAVEMTESQFAYEKPVESNGWDRWPTGPSVYAQSAIVMEADTGMILYAKDMEAKHYPASITKIMTAVVALETCSMDQTYTVTASDMAEGSSMYLQEGEILTIQELLYGLMLHSGNDAAVALAIYCGGTVEGFAQLMNDKARVLGMRNTHFENPHGLDAPDHYSTAKDLAILAAYAMENPIFHKTVSTKNITVGQRYLRNHNKLLWQVDGADGVKTGYTRAAGRILVSSAARDGRRLIAVTIHAPDDWNDHTALLNRGFADYSCRKILCAGDNVGTVEIAGGQQNCVELVAAQDFDYALAQHEQVELVIPGPGFVYAPVAEGADAGFAHICIDGKSVAKVPLSYGATIEKSAEEKKSWIDRLIGGD